MTLNVALDCLFIRLTMPETTSPRRALPVCVPSPAAGVYERVRLATFEVNLYVPAATPERTLDQVVVLLNYLDLRRQIEETVLYHLRTRSFLKLVTAEVDE
jgi:hypothetical protein